MTDTAVGEEASRLSVLLLLTLLAVVVVVVRGAPAAADG